MYFSLDFLGALIFSVPAALVVMLGREWFILQFRGAIPESNLWEKGAVNPFTRIDLWALFLLSLWGMSWGGLIQKGRKETTLTFILAQVWFVLVWLLVFIYYKLNHPIEESYLHYFLQEIMRQAWTLHLVNYLPLPPFDGSFFYAPKLNQNLRYSMKGGLTVLMFFGISENGFINGIDFLNWLNIG